MISLGVRPNLSNVDPAHRPTWTDPVVFHLHGIDEIHESLVLTEDDYLDFLVHTSRDEHLLPPFIQEALTGSSLLFVGYRLADWTFRVLFRGLVNSMEPSLRYINLAVQLSPDTPEQARSNIQNYLSAYFGNINVKVYWGSARQFAAELWDRWTAFRDET